VLGYAITKMESIDKNIALITEINKKYTPKVWLYQVATGKEFMVKISKKKFYLGDFEELIYQGDIIKVKHIEDKPAWKMVKEPKADNPDIIVDKWVQDKTRLEPYLERCAILRESPLRDNKKF
jgi:DNA polymerase III subunit alpha